MLTDKQALRRHLGFRPGLSAPQQIRSRPSRTDAWTSLTFISLALVGVGAGGRDAQDAADGVRGASRVRAHRRHLRHGARGHCAEGEGRSGRCGPPPEQRHSPYPGLMRPRSRGSAGRGECALRTLPLRPPLHLGDASSPPGPFAQVFCFPGGQSEREDGQLGGLAVQKGARDSVRRALAQIPACPRRQEAGEWRREGGGSGGPPPASAKKRT